MATPSDESVNYSVNIDVALALKNLADLTNATTNFNQKIEAATLAVQEASTKWGVSFGEAKAQIQGLDANLSGAVESSTVFGTAGQQAWNQVGQGAQTAGSDVEQGSNRMVGGINIVRTALHFLVVGAIFEVVNAFKTMFTEAISGLKQMEVSVYNLSNAERALSEGGMNVTFKDLEATVDRLHTKFGGLFSNVQLQDAVADIAISTKDLGLSVQQIEQIAQASAAIQLRNPDKTLQQVNQQVLTAILSGQTKGLRSLGIEANAATIQQKALEMGLVSAGQKMSDQAKSLATLQLVYEATVGDTKNLAQYQNDLTGVTQQLSSTWQDFLAEATKDFAPLLIQGLKILITDLQFMQAVLTKISPLIRDITSSVAAFVASAKGIGYIPTSLMDVVNVAETMATRFKANKQLYDNYFNQFIDNTDTATAAVQNLGQAFDSAGFQQEIQKIVQDSQNALEDLNTNLANKEADLNTKFQREQADALTAYQRKVQDIETEGAQKIQDIKNKARADNKAAEAKYQLDLWELQQKYLMDLEDALHNRDARQVLKLQQQYQFQKEDLAKKHQLEEQQRAQDVALQIKQAEEDTARKLAQAKLEYQRKLEDLNTAKQREQDDLNTWYQRELENLHTAEQRKLQTLIDSWVNQGKITLQGAQNVYNILKAYFGPGGMTDALYQYMANSLSGALATATGLTGYSQGGGLASPPSTTSGGTATNTTSLGTYAGGLAEGGTFLATTPQTVRVAENQPELVTATPLTGGQDMNKFFTNAAGGINNGQSALGGKLELGINLSPDLELRVIRKALDETANIVTRVNNSAV